MNDQMPYLLAMLKFFYAKYEEMVNLVVIVILLHEGGAIGIAGVFVLFFANSVFTYLAAIFLLIMGLAILCLASDIIK